MYYVNDTFVIILRVEIECFTSHINQVDPYIKFTYETEEGIQLRLESGSLKFTFFRKPTHTDQYLDFSSHHPLQHKYSVTRTLFYRAKYIVSDSDDLKQELPNISTALQHCGYPPWSIATATTPSHTPKQARSQAPTSGGKNFVLPNYSGVSQILQRIFKKRGVHVCFKPHRTLRRHLVRPNDEIAVEVKCGVVYDMKCKDSEDLRRGSHLQIRHYGRAFGHNIGLM